MEQTSALTRKRVRAAWWFLTPMIITLAMVAGWPLLRTFWFSLTNATLDGSGVAEFIGLDNYFIYEDGEFYGILFDPTWWQAVWNTLYFAWYLSALRPFSASLWHWCSTPNSVVRDWCVLRYSSPGRSRPSFRPKCGAGCCTISSGS